MATSTETAAEPTYRDAMIDKLAQRLHSSGRDWSGPAGSDWWHALAEAAVDELIDRPEREFQAQLAAIVARNAEGDSMGSWAPATASGWL